ncbi:hypothetical protein HDV00_010089 [Rhizophlyctis rosea]|nr:hypothetical protein HDV00_010089 [Rhizophlyctis rosea]
MDFALQQLPQLAPAADAPPGELAAHPSKAIQHTHQVHPHPHHHVHQLPPHSHPSNKNEQHASWAQQGPPGAFPPAGVGHVGNASAPWEGMEQQNNSQALANNDLLALQQLLQMQQQQLQQHQQQHQQHQPSQQQQQQQQQQAQQPPHSHPQHPSPLQAPQPNVPMMPGGGPAGHGNNPQTIAVPLMVPGADGRVQTSFALVSPHVLMQAALASMGGVPNGGGGIGGMAGLGGGFGGGGGGGAFGGMGMEGGMEGLMGALGNGGGRLGDVGGDAMRGGMPDAGQQHALSQHMHHLHPSVQVPSHQQHPDHFHQFGHPHHHHHVQHPHHHHHQRGLSDVGVGAFQDQMLLSTEPQQQQRRSALFGTSLAAIAPGIDASSTTSGTKLPKDAQNNPFIRSASPPTTNLLTSGTLPSIAMPSLPPTLPKLKPKPIRPSPGGSVAAKRAMAKGGVELERSKSDSPVPVVPRVARSLSLKVALPTSAEVILGGGPSTAPILGVGDVREGGLGGKGVEGEGRGVVGGDGSGVVMGVEKEGGVVSSGPGVATSVVVTEAIKDNAAPTTPVTAIPPSAQVDSVATPSPAKNASSPLPPPHSSPSAPPATNILSHQDTTSPTLPPSPSPHPSTPPPTSAQPATTDGPTTSTNNSTHPLDAITKRHRNTAASARFRAKKKLREQALERTARTQTARVKEIEGRLEEVGREVRWLRGLLKERDGKEWVEGVYGRSGLLVGGGGEGLWEEAAGSGSGGGGSNNGGEGSSVGEGEWGGSGGWDGMEGFEDGEEDDL